jgi:hypothetical protein
MLMIIKKYYDKRGNLKLLKKGSPENTIRFKVSKNKKEFPCCDWKGVCTNKAYAEVYPINKKSSWSYLCKKHYNQEQKRLNWKLPASLKVEW